MFKITRMGNPIGDKLLASFFVHILNDNEIECFLETTEYKEIIDCNYKNNVDSKKFEFEYYDKRDSNIIEIAIQKFKQKNNIEQEIKIKRDFIPVIYKEIENIKPFVVVLVTKSGSWAPVRNWPYFEQLKKKLQQNKITYIDVTENNIKNFEFLNYVKKCKVFVTLETGASHYASQFVNKSNSLVIQSGYCDDSFWNYYKYDVIKNDTECKWCFTQHKICSKGHNCMKNITVEQIFEKIIEKIEGEKNVKI